MELLLLLVFVAFSDDPRFKARLCSALEFYRDNRDLLRSLAETEKAPPKEGAQKDSPAAGESLKILETFLKGV